MGSHHLQVAVLVRDDKLECFDCSDKNGLAFYSGLLLPPRADGPSPLFPNLKGDQTFSSSSRFGNVAMGSCCQYSSVWNGALNLLKGGPVALFVHNFTSTFDNFSPLIFLAIDPGFNQEPLKPDLGLGNELDNQDPEKGKNYKIVFIVHRISKSDQVGLIQWRWSSG